MLLTVLAALLSLIVFSKIWHEKRKVALQKVMVKRRRQQQPYR